MNNDKVQPNRTSRIRKSIQRTLTTAKYESIVIHDEIEEDIEWSTLEERQKKIANWDTILLKSFKKTHDRVLEELNLSHKKAYFKDNLDKDRRLESGSTHELDGLDTLE